ncbi:uncharacterized protein PSFLO_00565 [Pseudozyma flocculosa]|uniref:Uncharacterized protein n=1 Tax=Pseudozyma flocculosa TaxID=84751 RepID=A0A5C3ERZ7_9BASI|nr:uncharacterized protein PSFLO_00565 [Pseudozyma flocculosa]
MEQRPAAARAAAAAQTGRARKADGASGGAEAPPGARRQVSGSKAQAGQARRALSPPPVGPTSRGLHPFDQPSPNNKVQRRQAAPRYGRSQGGTSPSSSSSSFPPGQAAHASGLLASAWGRLPEPRQDADLGKGGKQSTRPRVWSMGCVKRPAD